MGFKSALLKRVKLLKGLPIEKLHQLSDSLPLTPGAESLIKILKYLGYKIALVSGGFQFFIDKVRDTYGLDYGFANNLKIENGKVSGELEGQIINAEAKKKPWFLLQKKKDSPCVRRWPWQMEPMILKCWPGLDSESPSMQSLLCNARHEPA